MSEEAYKCQIEIKQKKIDNLNYEIASLEVEIEQIERKIKLLEEANS